MSYNIIRVKSKGELTAKVKGIKKFINDNEDNLPEDCFLHDLELDDLKSNDIVTMNEFQWCGTWSGNSLDTFEEDFLPLTKGKVSLIIIWEDGETTKWRIEDGVVVERKDE